MVLTVWRPAIRESSSMHARLLQGYVAHAAQSTGGGVSATSGSASAGVPGGGDGDRDSRSALTRESSEKERRRRKKSSTRTCAGRASVAYRRRRGLHR